MPATKQPTILIVEDDFALSDAFGMMVEHAGYRVAKAQNGREALDYIANHSEPDLILLDILMPVMDGKEFLEQYDTTRGTPIIVLSNLDAKADVEAVIARGATSYILKSSLTPDLLLKTVKQYV